MFLSIFFLPQVSSLVCGTLLLGGLGLIRRWLYAKGKKEDVVRPAWQSLVTTMPVILGESRRNLFQVSEGCLTETR